MSKNIIFLLLISSTVTLYGVDAQLLDVAKAIGSGVSYIYKAVTKGKEFWDELNQEPEMSVTSMYLSLKDTMNEIKDKLTKLEKESDNTVMKIRMNEMQEAIAIIDNYYEDFMAYSNVSANFSDYRRKTFAKDVLNHNVGLPNRIVIFHSNIVDRGEGSLIKIMEQNIETIDPYCSSGRTRQQYFYGTFLTVMATHFKAYLTMEYATEVSGEAINSTLTSEKERLQLKTVERINTTVSVFKDILKRASQDLWRCDPHKYEKNKDYFKLKNVFRVIFYDDRDFLEKRDIKCYGQCPATDRNTKLVAKCHEKKQCSHKQRICNNVVECTKILHSESYGLCVTHTDHGRRYTSVVDQNTLSWFDKAKTQIGNIFGSDVCNGNTFSLAQTYSQGQYNYEECVGCKCVCDETGSSDRYFSLKPVTSNIRSNKVVTGVQFVKANNTIYIQIKQAKLLPGGFISESSNKWKGLDEEDDNDDNNSDDNSDENSVESVEKKDQVFQKFAKLLSDESGSSKDHGKFKLDWFEKRGLYLDDIELPRGELVTGVKFSVQQQNNEYFVQINIRSTKFDADCGKLSPGDSYWYLTNAPEPKRSRLDLQNYDTPVSVSVANKPNNEPHQYTYITHSHLTSKDGGQNVIPYIDCQPVVSSPPAPLSGVGLDIKRGGDSGGYLILKIKTYNVLWLKN